MLTINKVEGDMQQGNFFASDLERERQIEEVLMSQRDAVTKVRRLVKLGVEEEEADEIVGRYQTGQMSPVYYERLEHFDEEDDAA